MSHIKNVTIRSAYLQENRNLSIFLPQSIRRQDTYPVVFCADGQAIDRTANFLANAMTAGYAPPVVLVGVHSLRETRAEDYLLGLDPPRFAAHERFFTEEVPRWVETHLGLAPARAECGIFGYSNGGAFAVSLGQRHREKFGVAIAFSISRAPEQMANSEFKKEPKPRFYLAVGTRERLFKKNTRHIEKMLTNHGVEHTYVEREAGHDYEFWKEELPTALAWAFGGNRKFKVSPYNYGAGSDLGSYRGLRRLTTNMPPEDQPRFSAIRDHLVKHRFHPKIAVLAARVHLEIDSEEQAWKWLDPDQHQHFLEALRFVRESFPLPQRDSQKIQPKGKPD